MIVEIRHASPLPFPTITAHTTMSKLAYQILLKDELYIATVVPLCSNITTCKPGNDGCLVPSLQVINVCINCIVY